MWHSCPRIFFLLCAYRKHVFGVKITSKNGRPLVQKKQFEFIFPPTKTDLYVVVRRVKTAVGALPLILVFFKLPPQVWLIFASVLAPCQQDRLSKNLFIQNLHFAHLVPFACIIVFESDPCGSRFSAYTSKYQSYPVKPSS